jgi:predicted TIM-barrel fold metal-dependent hydrolase
MWLVTDPTHQKANPAAPFCAAYDPDPKVPRLVLPPQCCDCHAHICGPAGRYAYAADRIYTPPDALLPAYLKMLGKIGAQRAVLVQPSVYGTDHRVLLKALKECPLPCRGIAVLAPSIADRDLEELHRAGIRGVRFNLVDVRNPLGTIDLAAARTLAERVKPLGWHAEFLVHVDDYPDLDRLFLGFPVDMVFGHLGYLRPPLSAANEGFQALLRLLRGGRCWVKLTGPTRISAGEMPYPDVTPIAQVLADAAPDRLIWGSDWPHVKLAREIPNDGDLVDLLTEWIPDPARRRQVLVDNPEKLYDFTA